MHARVLPSILVEMLTRPFKTWLGDIIPGALVRWSRAGDPPSSIVDDMRQDALRRLRVRSESIWLLPCKVRRNPDWNRWLDRQETAWVEALLVAHPGRELQDLSLNEVKTGLRKPWEYTLGLLARIEAVDWVAPAADPQRRNGWSGLQQFVSLPPAKLSAEDRQAVEEALKLPWVESIAAGDLRLAAPVHEAPAAWIRHEMAAENTSPHVVVVARRILEADSLSYSDELSALAWRAIKRSHPSPSKAREESWVGMLLARFAGDRPGTLQEVGDSYGITRERVRQICDALLEVLRAQPASMPSLERVLRMAARTAPCSVDDANEQLRSHLGLEASILSAIQFAKTVGVPIPLRMVPVKVRVAGRYEEAYILEPVDEAEWAQAALGYAASDCSVIGCTNVIRVAGMLALRDELAPGRAFLEAVLKQAPGFRWLGDAGGWFSIGDTNTSGAATRLRKILAVATDPVSVDSVAEAYACETRWFRSDRTDDGRHLAIPPTHVIQAMVDGWPWVKRLQFTKFFPVESISLDLLTDVEREIVRIIAGNGGVAAAWQMYEAVPDKLSVSKMAVSVTLAQSPVLQRLEHGLYTLRGRRYAASALEEARAKLATKLTGAVTEGASSFRLRISQAVLINEQHNIPAQLRAAALGKPVLVEGAPSSARVGASGVIRRLNRCFPGLAPGDELEVTLDGESLNVTRCTPTRGCPIA